MKILLLSPLPPPNGGIATWTKKYFKYCNEFGIDAEIVNIAPIGKRALQINTSRSLKDEILRTRNIFQNLNRGLKKGKYDIVHINTSCEKFGIIRDLICCIIAKRHGVKVLVHCRCNLEFQIKNYFSSLIFKVITNMADKILVLNKSSFNFMKKYSIEKAEILPNFIEETFANTPFTVRKELKKIVFVGHVQFSKGVREIYEVAQQMPQISFSLIGPVKDEVKKLLLPSNIKLLGELSHDKIEKELMKSDLFLFPSYTEGFANALLEAMACGLPVIASDVGANLEMLENIGGIVIPARDSNAIATAIKQVKDQSKREKMSNWNCKKVKDTYIIPVVMDNLFVIYCNMLGENMK